MAVKVTNKDGKIKRRYPDVVIVCGEIIGKPKKKSDEKNILILFNPTLIIEVVSDGTKDIDESIKVNEYKKIESLEEYLIVYQDTRKIYQYKKVSGEWLENPETIETNFYLDSIKDLELNFDDIYEKTGV